MASDDDTFDDYDDSVFEDEEEILSDGEDEGLKKTGTSTLKKHNMAAWRKIEEFWDNYKLNKQINDDPYNDKYSDYLLDGELN